MDYFYIGWSIHLKNYEEYEGSPIFRGNSVYLFLDGLVRLARGQRSLSIGHGSVWVVTLLAID